MSIQVRDHRFTPGTIMNLGDYLRERAELDYLEKQIIYKAQYNKTHTKRKKEIKSTQPKVVVLDNTKRIRKPREQKALSEDEINRKIIEVLRDDRKERMPDTQLPVLLSNAVEDQGNGTEST